MNHNKPCFQLHMAYEDLPRRTTFDKVLLDKAFHIAKNPKYDGYQGELASMASNKFFEKSLPVMVLIVKL